MYRYMYMYANTYKKIGAFFLGGGEGGVVNLFLLL